jgi:WD repeat-containing protein 68
MPLFGGHHRSSSSTASSSAQQNVPGGIASNLLQAAQVLGSVGTPSAASTRTTAAATATAPAAPPPASAYRSRSPTASSSHTFNAAPAQPAAQPPNHSPSNAMMSNPAAPNNNAQQHFETPRRQHQAYARHPDELHMGDADSTTAAAAAQKGPLSPRDYGPGGAPRINLEQATPESSNYQSNLPGPLQSGGGASRPPTLSSNSTPAVPALQSTMPADPFATPLRSNQNLSHNYSRSSPSTGYDGQAYQPYTTTPGGGSELSQYSTPSSLKYAPGQQRNVSNTPLGLADIRPRADSTLSDAVLPGANPYSYDGANAVPTNSNYLAPWAIYAFDWCKWPAHNNDAGKVAVGSYLEDGHNFVGLLCCILLLLLVLTLFCRYKSSKRRSSLRHQNHTHHPLPNMASNSRKSQRPPTHTPSHACYGSLHLPRSNRRISSRHQATTSASGLSQQTTPCQATPTPSPAPRTTDIPSHPASSRP